MVEPEGEPWVTLNGVRRPLRSPLLADLVREAGHDPSRPGIAVAVNGEVIPRASWTLRRLERGDEIEVVGAVQGG